MDTKQFHEERATGIGGSDAAAIMNMSKWSTPLDVYMEKVGLTEPKEPNEVMEWGKILEPLIVQAVEEQFDVIVDPHLDKDGNEKLWREGVAIAHIDGTFLMNTDEGVFETVLLECKTVNPFSFKLEWNPETNQVPYEYFCQVQHYMFVTGLKKCLLAAWVDRTMHYFWINFSEEFVEVMIQKEQEFWEKHVELKIPPPKSTGADVNKMMEGLVDEPIPATIELMRLLDRHEELNEEKKMTEDELGAIKAEIANTMGEYLRAEKDGVQVAKWIKINQKRVDAKKLKEKYPGAHEECSKPSSYLRLYINLKEK
jgi:putative phage-type endonuclease